MCDERNFFAFQTEIGAASALFYGVSLVAFMIAGPEGALVC